MTDEEAGGAEFAAPYPLRSKSPEWIEQEYYGLLIAYNSVRALMAEAAHSAEAAAKAGGPWGDAAKGVESVKPEVAKP